MDQNNATGAEVNATASAASSILQFATAVVRVLTNDIPTFAVLLATNPFEALKMTHVVVLLVLLPALLLWLRVQLADIRSVKQINLDAPIEDDLSASAADFDLVKKKARESPKNLAVWQVGVSHNAVAVSEEASLLGFNFFKTPGTPTVTEISETICLVMIKPFEGIPRRPSTIAFLPSRVVSDAQVKEISDRIVTVFDPEDIRVVTMEEIESEIPKLREKRAEEIKNNPTLAAPSVVQAAAQATAVQKATAAASGDPSAKPAQQKLPMNPTPPRGCFVCKKDIEAKTKQCSACKSTKDWPNHKIMCPIYKSNMDRLAAEELHALPFEFYNGKKQLDNYNQVPFLVEKELHNVGVYRRLCQCFQQLQWGELSGELEVQMTADAIKNDEQKKFKCTGLPEELYPLGRPLKEGVDPDRINNWEDWYNAYDLPLSSPVSLVFEVPLTVFFLVKKYAANRTINGRRQLTLHMLGTERESDLIHLFSYLLPLFPNTDIIIHMVSPVISKRLRPEHTAFEFKSENSTLAVTLTSAEYGLVHYDSSYFASTNKKTAGATPPDLVLILNGSVFQYQTFAPTIKLLMDKKARIVFTEPIETAAVVMGKQFENMKWNLSIPIMANPFRQPVFQWKKEVNLPGWSNGFITGANIAPPN
ncbi:hypothetical protein HK100_003877 [Physocladia obscura]|uniref:Mitochondrial splicing suppressor 51-like C-terminal domain-containing protein n=1 Tax=Physocladia obscura TaxID=109957 RepID=A0AAD5XKS1_9FUNG|nr:hypothetical protein HK100_003877 [Physocladia obscura]